MVAKLYELLRQTSLVRRGRRRLLRFETTIYRIAAVLGPPPFRWVARARDRALHGDCSGAVAAWEALIFRTNTTKPTWHYEFSICLYRHGDIGRAQDQQRAAFHHNSENPFDYRRLAARAITNNQQDVASRAYERAAACSSNPDQFAGFIKRAARTAFDFGEWDRAEDLFLQAIENLERTNTADPLSHAGLADALRKAGRLNDAEDVVSRARQDYPTSGLVASAAAWVATERRDWEAAAQRWPLAFATCGRGLPSPRGVFRYGDALEKLHYWNAAAEVYALALNRLSKVNSTWAHWAILEWEYRRAYCDHRSGCIPRTEPQYLVTLTVPETHLGSAKPDRTSDDRFAIDITHLGLRVSGLVSDAAIESVSVAIDDRIVKQVDIDHSQAVGKFLFNIRHASLESFPQQARVSVLAGEHPLRDEYGSTTAEVHCPFGSGNLFERLERGEVFTKKGALVPMDLIQISPQRLLDAYTRLRTFFAERLDLDLFLMYGTLLGCHRDGRFIPGDDDLDVGFVTSCSDPVSLKQEAIRITNVALAAGFDVTPRYGGSLFKIWINEIDIDIYPIWFHLGRAWGYDAMVADRNDFLPTSRCTFLGSEVLVPCNPDKLLDATYGANWRTPQPGFRHYRPKSVINMINRTALTPRQSKELMEANAEAGSAPPSGVTQEVL